MNIFELKDKELDHAVAKALNWKLVTWGDRQVWVQNFGEGRWRCNEEDWKPSTDWNQGGVIIEKHQITIASLYATAGELGNHPSEWHSNIYEGISAKFTVSGGTALIAAMRCFVRSVFETNPEYFA